MNSLKELSEAVAGVASLGQLPADLAEGGAFLAAVDGNRRVSLAFNPTAAQWVLGADMTLGSVSEEMAAAARESMLRRSFDGRFTDGRIGGGDEEGRLSCSVLLDQLPEEATQVEHVFDGLLRELDELVANYASQVTHVVADTPGFSMNWIKA